MLTPKQATKELKDLARRNVDGIYQLVIEGNGEKRIRSKPEIPDLAPGIYSITFTESIDGEDTVRFSEKVEVEEEKKEKTPPADPAAPSGSWDREMIRELMAEMRSLRDERNAEKGTFYESMIKLNLGQMTQMEEQHRRNIEWLQSAQKAQYALVKEEMKSARAGDGTAADQLMSAAAEVLKESGPEAVKVILEKVSRGGTQL